MNRYEWRVVNPTTNSGDIIIKLMLDGWVRWYTNDNGSEVFRRKL